MTKPLISVIIPVYKVERYLDECVESVVNQTYTNLEIILVDDGSPDNCPAMCDEWAKKDLRIVVIHKENGGVSRARNVALEKVSGEYICFVDSDDIVDKNLISYLYENMIKTSADITICPFKIIYNDSLVGNRALDDIIEYTQRDALKDILLSKTFTGSPWGKLFKTDEIKNLTFDEDIFYGEDMLFVVKAIKNAGKVAFVPRSYYNYYIREGSASTSAFSDKRFTDMISRQRIFEEIWEMKDDELSEIAHISIVIADIIMLQQLYCDKSVREKYCTIIQKSIRENFKLRRIKYVDKSIKKYMLLAVVSYKLFFAVIYIKNIIKKIIKRGGLYE